MLEGDEVSGTGTSGDARLGVDIGGTFTDIAYVDRTGELRIDKVLTTTDSPERAVQTGMSALEGKLHQLTSFVHGTTLVINSLLERRLARTALVTTQGFRDVLELARGSRPEIFNPFYRRLSPLIERDLRFEVTERVDGEGNVLSSPTLPELTNLAALLEEVKVEAVAVAFINAYLQPSNEAYVARALAERLPTTFITTSTEVSGQCREYERFNSAAANACVGPLVDRYLSGIEKTLAAEGFRGEFSVLDSTGGGLDSSQARKLPLRLIESGPAGGVLGAILASDELGAPNVVTFDMGGTTAKSALIEEGGFHERDVYYVGGYERGIGLQVPSIDIFEVGAGGGSIAWADVGGELRVGPISAGSEPGPACYGRGGNLPTVTDANVVAGRLVPEFFRARISLSPDAAAEAVGSLADRLGTSVERMAIGIIDVANAAMASMLRRQTVELGRDPDDFAVLAIGGAGPLHAAEVAAAVGIQRVIVPPAPGHFSAIGMLQASRRLDRRQAWMYRLSELDGEETRRALDSLYSEVVTALGLTRAKATPVDSARWWAAVRYVGQEHTLRVPIGEDRLPAADTLRAMVREAFEREYLRSFGRLDELSEVEITELSVEVVPQAVRPIGLSTGAGARSGRGAATTAQAEVSTDGGTKKTSATVVAREDLRPGEELVGPAIVYEEGSNTYVPPGAVLVAAESDYLHMSLGKEVVR